MSSKTKIGIGRECLTELYNAKFDFHVNTLEEAIRKLLSEHRQSKRI